MFGSRFPRASRTLFDPCHVPGPAPAASRVPDPASATSLAAVPAPATPETSRKALHCCCQGLPCCCQALQCCCWAL